MDIRHLTPGYAVSPQIDPADVAALKAAGFTTVICNRPDAENPPEMQAAAIRAVVEAAGMTFVLNPIIGGKMTEQNITDQGTVIDAASGPVFAYCASGNRCSMVWALAEAGRESADTLINAGAKFGYQLEALRPAIEARAQAQGQG